MTTQTASKSANKNRFEIDVTKIRDDARKHMAEIIRWIGDADPTTRRLMEKILEQGEEHADDLNDLLGN
ncbi:MAG: bacterioferritin [Mycobacterium sp.]|jgi:bacterioferritin (cytochrome b1)|nr:bacterioferritin [Mycobacterium sp.]